jgi:hypothetical protein
MLFYPFGNQTHGDTPAETPLLLSSEERQQNAEQSHYQNHHRAGKFEHLSGFVKGDGSIPRPDYRNYSLVTADPPGPGQIIHIVDGLNTPQSPTLRLNERVILVIRHEASLAMTCVPLCRHGERHPETEEQHWKVQAEDQSQDTTQSSIVPAGRPLLRIRLFKKGHTLEQGITINLTELWHVEYEKIMIDKLGLVQSDDWHPLLDKIKDLFCESLDACRINSMEFEEFLIQQSLSHQPSRLEQHQLPEIHRESSYTTKKQKGARDGKGRRKRSGPSVVLCCIL